MPDALKIAILRSERTRAVVNFAVGIMTRWTPGAASRGRAGTGRESVPGPPASARAHLGSADQRTPATPRACCTR